MSGSGPRTTSVVHDQTPSGHGRALVVGFQFFHHGRHTAFLPFASEMADQRVVDVTPPYPRWLPRRIRDRIWSNGLYYAEYGFRHALRCGPESIVHYFFSENTLYRGAEWKGRKKLIATVHQPVENLRRLVRQPVASRFLRALRMADAVVVLGREELALRDMLPDGTRMEVIPLGVDTEYFAPTLKPSRQGGGQSLSVLTVGNWLRDYACWAETVRLMSAQGHEIEWSVIANPETLTTARQMLGPAPARVRWLQNITDDELHRIYGETDILFVPLVNAVANCALLEGMASGLPIVATDLPAAREYVGDADGVFVPKGDAAACAHALGLLAGSDETRLKRGIALRARAVEKFSWKAIGAQYRALYREMARDE